MAPDKEPRGHRPETLEGWFALHAVFSATLCGAFRGDGLRSAAVRFSQVGGVDVSPAPRGWPVDHGAPHWLKGRRPRRPLPADARGNRNRAAHDAAGGMRTRLDLVVFLLERDRGRSLSPDGAAGA